MVSFIYITAVRVIKFTLSYLMVILCISVYSQEYAEDSLLYLNGIVALPSDSTGIPDVHVLNLSKGTGTVTSLTGAFMLSVRNQDTLKFSCIGYQDHFLIISSLLIRIDMMVFLHTDTVFMDEVLISPLGPRRFFKLRFMETRVQGEKAIEIDLHLPGIKKDPAYTPPTGIRFTGPVQFLYDAFNRSARLHRKLRKNREKYSKYIQPVVGDSLKYPEKIK